MTANVGRDLCIDRFMRTQTSFSVLEHTLHVLKGEKLILRALPTCILGDHPVNYAIIDRQ